ncbi:MAG: hypothetical protein ACREL5_06555 [Gemmatimonadales bacterium]
MTRSLRFVMLGAFVVLAGCSGDTSSDHALATGTWASAQAALTVSDTGAVLLIKASPDCYGSLATTSEPITGTAFSVRGTYSQLTGAYPGHVDYSAILTGTVGDNEVSVAVAVAGLQQTFGPYALTQRSGGWSACAYP